MKPRALIVLPVLFFVILACNMPTAVSELGAGTETPSQLTQIAQTVLAELTATAEAATPTESPTPDVTPSPTETRQIPATWTPVPQVTTAVPCDQAAFIQDVTIPDGMKMNPGTTFTKTWRLRNIGTCTWTTAYAAVFVSGEAMSAPATVPLPGSVAPNETVDITVNMRAPDTPGRYTGYWRLRNANGQQFSASGTQPFYVMIEVTQVTPTVTITPTITATVDPTSGVAVNFVDTMCQAEWRSQSGVLPCPGDKGDQRGFVRRLTNPQLETGMNESNPVLLTFPQATTDGAITGKFPPVAIQAGDRFQAVIGCLYGAEQCSVIYQLNYIVGSGSPVNLGQWTHTYSSAVKGIDVDLSPLAGQQAQIILAVLADGSPEGDRAVWVYPRIVRH